MPPRKTATKNSSNVKTSRKTASVNGPRTTRAYCCDGCTAEIPKAEVLNCKVSVVLLHRHCAWITSDFVTIAASFICAACSLTASKSVILELWGEIDALKAEVIELRAAMEDMKLKQQVLNPSAERQTPSNGLWARVVNPISNLSTSK